MTAQFEKEISVLLVDDHPPLRAGIRAMIQKTPDLYVIGEAQDGEEARRLLEELRPNVVLLDLVMPGFSPFAFERWARENYPKTITLVLTSHDRDAYLASMMDAGAAGYLDKSMRAEGLMDAIRRAAHGENIFDEGQKLRAQRWREDIEKKWAASRNAKRKFCACWRWARPINISRRNCGSLPRPSRNTWKGSIKNWVRPRAPKLHCGEMNMYGIFRIEINPRIYNTISGDFRHVYRG